MRKSLHIYVSLRGLKDRRNACAEMLRWAELTARFFSREGAELVATHARLVTADGPGIVTISGDELDLAHLQGYVAGMMSGLLAPPPEDEAPAA